MRPTESVLHLIRVQGLLGFRVKGFRGPRGSIYTTIMELGFLGPSSIMVVYMDP